MNRHKSGVRPDQVRAGRLADQRDELAAGKCPVDAAGPVPCGISPWAFDLLHTRGADPMDCRLCGWGSSAR